MSTDINSLLIPFQRFGVHLGLERINKLLMRLGNPHHQIPIIHVTGTNGKGSVCAYLSSIMTQAGYKVGRYTSPHLVDWTERICLNEIPISTETLTDILKTISTVILPDEESPTQFEVITAAAWYYFAQNKVDLAILEVGLGGRLDATNVCENPLVSVITSISREHWQTLGPTIAHIATEKAGILKLNCPAVIGHLPPCAEKVVLQKTQHLNCPTIWVDPSIPTQTQHAHYQLAKLIDIEYPLPLLGQVQLMNSAIAMATLGILRQKGWIIPDEAIQEGMKKTFWPGRLQWIQWQNNSILIDGAHNPAAAEVLRQYVDTLPQPIHWVMGMLSTKDHEDIFQAILRQNDQLSLVPVPDHSTANPDSLAVLARNICPNLSKIQTFSELFVALDTAIQKNIEPKKTIVLCGSLYLVGYFLAKMKIN
ncbi:bifunctional folylpolyglutamate synthase/dihydrofolate synthase [Aphanothece hegewaldii CCALA 016]|uniref:Dihydrofolate synthase/folylpolyglutamate synthase n=1 Tax=Aphanothece hegewaldii CCALA 016 TaxID=2107694 RepID=A0A2T1LRC7_9CHRO|nr:folylpolyglutamate synthase/dihydrofolate synthase family protein [Aphanothece hegewaldii]PSF31122.1 bifunctional folylpolyglutamate synthase/dihydrofolate synthase [Aphanothece hegewaldii CCALA 016]